MQTRSIKTFDQLSTTELHAIYFLRAQVFVVEQNCAYQDVDSVDLTAHHLQIYENTNLVGYARIIAPDSHHHYSKIGRVVSAPNKRNQAIGKQIMHSAIAFCFTTYAQTPIVISAQQYLLKFYEAFGFVAEGDGYLEDNIPHQQMRLLPKV